MKKIILTFSIILFGLITISCTPQNYENDVFVTVYPLQYIIEKIFEDTDLTVDLVPGVSSHNEAIDWSPKEIIAMGEADFLFYVGANFDTYIDNQVGQIFTNKHVQLIKTENNLVDFIQGIVHVHEEDENHALEPTASDALGYDPHFWISPKRMITVAENIYPILVAYYPELSDKFATNYTTLMSNLNSLDQAFTTLISASTVTIMTSTNLYSYLHEDYGLEFIPISPGYHEETDQFTSAQKQEIVDEAIIHDVTHIIFERDSSSPFSTAVMASLVSLGYDVQKLEFIIMDSLHHVDIENYETYLTLMYKNYDVIAKATNQLGD